MQRSAWPSNITTLLNKTAAAFDLIFAKAGVTAGSVSIVYGDQVVLSHGYGTTLSNKNGQAANGDTLFAVGSISKMLTVADALILQEVCDDEARALFFASSQLLLFIYPSRPACCR